MTVLHDIDAGTARWQGSKRPLRRILCVLDREENVIVGYVRHLGVSPLDCDVELYQIEDPGWDPFTITGDDILEIADADRILEAGAS